MLSDEFLTAHAERINWIVDRAEAMGDGAPCLGTIVLLSLSESDFRDFQTPNHVSVANIINNAEARFKEAGIKTE